MSRGSRRTSKVVNRIIEHRLESGKHVAEGTAWLGERAVKASTLKRREAHVEDVSDIPVGSIGQNRGVVSLEGSHSLPLLIFSTVDLELIELKLVGEPIPVPVEVPEKVLAEPQIPSG